MNNDPFDFSGTIENIRRKKEKEREDLRSLANQANEKMKVIEACCVSLLPRQERTQQRY
jgi:hypothetical protein